jgi:hypothetical protein
MVAGFEIAGRIAAALCGGYAFAWAVAAGFAVTLPLPPPDAVLVSGMASFIAYVGFVLWCFSVRWPQRKTFIASK